MSEHSAEKDAAEYVFTFDVIASDREGYYFDRWDRANRYEVIGKTKKHALSVLWPIVGAAPRGRYWKARQVGTATDVRLRQTTVTSPAECDRGPCYLGYDHDGPCKPGHVLPPGGGRA